MIDTRAGTISLHDLIKIVEKVDQLRFSKFKKIIQKNIKNGAKRIITVDSLVDIYEKNSIREKLILGKRIKNQE